MLLIPVFRVYKTWAAVVVWIKHGMVCQITTSADPVWRILIGLSQRENCFWNRTFVQALPRPIVTVKSKHLHSIASGVIFIKHFTHAFFVRKCFAQVFSNYSLVLGLFSEKMSAQKVLVECWCNWLQIIYSLSYLNQNFACSNGHCDSFRCLWFDDLKKHLVNYN